MMTPAFSRRALVCVLSLLAGVPVGCVATPTELLVPANGSHPIPVFSLARQGGTVTVSLDTVRRTFATTVAAKTQSTDVTDWVIDLVANRTGGIPGNTGMPGVGYPVDYSPGTTGAPLAHFVLNKAGDIGTNRQMKFMGVGDGTYRIRASAFQGTPPPGGGTNITRNFSEASGPFALSENTATVSGLGTSVSYTTAGFSSNSTALDVQVKLLDGTGGMVMINSTHLVQTGANQWHYNLKPYGGGAILATVIDIANPGTAQFMGMADGNYQIEGQAFNGGTPLGSIMTSGAITVSGFGNSVVPSNVNLPL